MLSQVLQLVTRTIFSHLQGMKGDSCFSSSFGTADLSCERPAEGMEASGKAVLLPPLRDMREQGSPVELFRE